MTYYCCQTPCQKLNSKQWARSSSCLKFPGVNKRLYKYVQSEMYSCRLWQACWSESMCCVLPSLMGEIEQLSYLFIHLHSFHHYSSIDNYSAHDGWSVIAVQLAFFHLKHYPFHLLLVMFALVNFSYPNLIIVLATYNSWESIILQNNKNIL